MTRLPLTDDLDFNQRERSSRIEVEVTVGDLGEPRQQDFFDQLEAWGAEAGDVVAETANPTVLDRDEAEPAVRLCYRARWNDEAEVGEQWVGGVFHAGGNEVGDRTPVVGPPLRELRLVVGPPAPSELGRGEHPEGGVGTVLVVLGSPVGDEDLGLEESNDPALR